MKETFHLSSISITGENYGDHHCMRENEFDVDARWFYLGLADPQLTFNQTEITLSHLFRYPSEIIEGRTYSDCLFGLLSRKGFLRSRILEVGGGLGDVAYNFLSTTEFEAPEYYGLLDISPRLLEVQKQKVQDLATDYILGDSQELLSLLQSFDGLVVSNGMIADLRSVYVDSVESIERYLREDGHLLDFAQDWGRYREPWYLHIGALRFLRSLFGLLTEGSSAAVLEYEATSSNQPSWFDNHYECGISFDQLEAYCREVGFHTQVADLEEILGCSPELLTVDVFTRQQHLVREIPQIVKLWTGKASLPVRAYSRKELGQALAGEQLGLAPTDSKALLRALDNRFFPLSDPRFDSKNPTTWEYKCLLLTKGPTNADWRQVGADVAVSTLSEVLGIDSAAARKKWETRRENEPMGIDVALEFVFEALVSGVIYEVVRAWGAKLWLDYAEKAMLRRLQSGSLDATAKDALRRAFSRAIGRERRRRTEKGERSG